MSGGHLPPAVVPAAERVEELRRMRLSPPLIRMTGGRYPHDLLRDIYAAPSLYSESGLNVSRLATPIVPLWDRGDSVHAVRRFSGGLLFLEVDIEDPTVGLPLARTEAGYWAGQIDFLYECDEPTATLRAVASSVGFEHLDFQLASRTAAEPRLGTHEGHATWLAAFVADIDRRHEQK